MAKFRLTSSVVLASVLSACQFSESRYLPRQVHRDEVVGNWVGTNAGMEGLRYAQLTTELRPEQHQLRFLGDGTCTGHAVVGPDIRDTGLTGLWITADTGCTWSLRSDDGHQALEIVREARGEPPGRLSLYFDEDKDGLLLWGYATDPDAWRYVEFSKSRPAG